MFNLRSCKKILKGYLNLGWTVSGSTINNPMRSGSSGLSTDLPEHGVYIALGTANGTMSLTEFTVSSVVHTLLNNFTEVAVVTGADANNYARMLLSAKGLGGHRLLSTGTSSSPDSEFIVDGDILVGDVSQTIEVTMTPPGSATSETTTETRTAAYTNNHQEYIMGNYTGLTGSGWGTVDSFAIFPNNGIKPSTGYSGWTDNQYKYGDPIYYGKLKLPVGQSNVSIPANVVPIFLKDNFVITLS